ncbi:hypothetical protein LTR15_008772 [Elasticomyces elasticus]|nr:hypothetical protein LTR15_008772 [Elasticomyces elasticus]
MAISGEPIRVVVGKEDPRTFYVHETVLCKESAFFQAACKKEWTEGQERKIMLPDQAPDTFHAYLQWSYTGRVPWDPDVRPRRLVKMWLLADYLMAPKLQDIVADTLIGTARPTKCLPSGESVSIAYSQTGEGSVMRKLLVYLYVRSNRSSLPNRHEFCHDFVLDLADALMCHRRRDLEEKAAFEAVIGKAPCRFHVHTDDETCSVGQAVVDA